MATEQDSNCLGNIEQTIATGSINSNKNGIRTEPATELKEITFNGQQQQQQQKLKQSNNSISKVTSESSTRTNSINSLPLAELEQQQHQQQHGKRVNVKSLHVGAIALAATTLEKKSSPKTTTQSVRKAQFQKQQNKANSEDKPLVVVPRTDYLDPNDLLKLKYLNRHSCNSRLDFESIERQQGKNIEAFGVLIQYLAYELDAFSCPKYKNESLKAKESIQKTMHLLEAAKQTCAQLQDQLSDKEAYYSQREEELQNLHRFELDKARENFNDLQKQAKEEIAGLENQLCEKEMEHGCLMKSYQFEVETKSSEKLAQLEAAQERENELKQRLSALDASTISLQNKLTMVEEEAAKKAYDASERERALNARITDLTNELERLHTQKSSPTHEQNQRDRSDLSNDEIAILRPIRSSYDSRLNMSSSRGTPRASLPNELTRLESEVESLRYVLEMRQTEISRLTKQNEELLRDADDRAAMNAKISKLTADIEMLQSELGIKTEKEKEYLFQLDKMQKDISHEKTIRTRLGYDNEALQWQLKQRSEQLHIVEAKLHETINSSHSYNGSTTRCSSMSNYSSLSLGPSKTDVSPPLSPIIKGVIEKPDSVAYVLEIDDETPEIAASKLVKRASTVRSIERSPILRRNLSLNANENSHFSATFISGPIPLSQSMSAASIRQHSSDTQIDLNGSTHARIRSRSVSVKDEPASSRANLIATTDISKALQSQTMNELLPQMDKKKLHTSSPYQNNIRPRTSTMKQKINDIDHDDDDEEGDGDIEDDDENTLYKHLGTNSKISTQSRLITCDTSALNTGERLDGRMLPSHPSINDFKVPKQFQQIKESAGEAMVSGANSEDEGCSASSDDMINMHSSTSTDISAAHVPLDVLQSAVNMSLEQALLMDKSLSGTPMEMSWSDDVIEVNELLSNPIAVENAASDA